MGQTKSIPESEWKSVMVSGSLLGSEETIIRSLLTSPPSSVSPLWLELHEKGFDKHLLRTIKPLEYCTEELFVQLESLYQKRLGILVTFRSPKGKFCSDYTRPMYYSHVVPLQAMYNTEKCLWFCVLMSDGQWREFCQKREVEATRVRQQLARNLIEAEKKLEAV